MIVLGCMMVAGASQVECKSHHMEQPSQPAGRLGTRGAINCGICYAVLQAMFITGSIASQYRVMVYHVDFANIDLSKIAPLARIWSIFCEFSLASPAPVPGNVTGAGDMSAGLDELLHANSQSHTTAIHVYKVCVPVTSPL